MDNDGASDQRQKELAISFAASSMINASDMINQEAYQANLKRIQEVKEMARRLEMNNETAHKNFLVDQLEKRAKDGREAEIVLTRLRSQPGLHEVRFTNNAPSQKSDGILPTTATLVEVPESRSSSYSSPAPVVASPLQSTQHDRPAEYQWSIPPQVHQAQPYYPNIFRYYAPPSAALPQHSAAPHSMASINGQMGWYTTQNMSPQFRVHNSLPHKPGLQHVQQPAQPWGIYPQPFISLPTVETAPVSYSIPPGWARTLPAQSTGTPGAGFSAQPTMSGPPVTTHRPLQNLPSHALISHVQVPLHGVAAPPAKVTLDQPTTRSYPKPAESQFQSVFTAVPKPVAISELQRSHKPSQHPQPPQPRSQPQQFLRSLEPQPCSKESPSQPPLQPHQTHLRAPSQPVDAVPLANAFQPHSQPSQIRESLPVGASNGASQAHPTYPIMVQGQAREQGAQSNADQATFIKFFQFVLQRGIPQLKAFLYQAKTSGISDEWFRAAINSLPRGVWESVVSQVNQSGPAPGFLSPVNVPQQGTLAIPGPNVPVVNTRSSIPATVLVPTTLATQLPAKPGTSAEQSFTLSAPEQTSGSYAAQIQYYAEQATKSTLSAQVASVSTTTPSNTLSTQKMPALDVPHAQANVRTPKDANKTTLARDVLRSLGKMLPKRRQETGGEPMAEDNDDRGSDHLHAVSPTQSVSHTAAPRSPVVAPATSSIRVDTPSISSGEPDTQVESSLLTAKPVSKEKAGPTTVVKEPIMIDLTLGDSDESVHEKWQELEPTFPIQRASANAATSSHPVSPNRITNHTPLLENLSLKEWSVDVAADGDSADVRMHSPPVSTPTEENMESELLYPPLGGAELVSSSFEPLPREASEHSPDGQLPLFLPSPPVSPAHTEPPETDLEMTNDEDERKISLKRCSVDVDGKESNTETLTPRVRKRRRQQIYVLIPPAPPYVRKAIEKTKERTMGKDTDLDSEGVGEDEEFRYSRLEQLLIEESKSRLLERRCRWSNCGAILNCAANLLVHLKNHAREEDKESPFLCRWASCSKQFDMGQERDVHLERHTIRPLPCPFAGCDRQFDKPVEVMQHEVQHQKAERTEPLIHKRTCQPVVPAIPAHLGRPPHWLPSHRVIARRVVRCRISADRHATMGPWILWNIFSPVELHTRKQNASMRGRPTRQAVDYDMESSDSRRDDYDFLLALSSYPAKSAELDDLDSTLVTMSAARGLTLWGSERKREETGSDVVVLDISS